MKMPEEEHTQNVKTRRQQLAQAASGGDNNRNNTQKERRTTRHEKLIYEITLQYQQRDMSVGLSQNGRTRPLLYDS